MTRRQVLTASSPPMLYDYCGVPKAGPSSSPRWPIRGPSARETRLIEWERAPSVRACHPREEHLLPLMVIAGAGGDDPGTVPYKDIIYGAHTCAVQFG